MCSVKEAFEYTFDDIGVDARCWFDMYVGNGFFAVHFTFQTLKHFNLKTAFSK